MAYVHRRLRKRRSNPGTRISRSRLPTGSLSDDAYSDARSRRMDPIKQSISWWCFTQKDMTIERMVRIATDIGYQAIELVEQEHWQELQYKPIVQAIVATGYK